MFSVKHNRNGFAAFGKLPRSLSIRMKGEEQLPILLPYVSATQTPRLATVSDEVFRFKGCDKALPIRMTANTDIVLTPIVGITRRKPQKVKPHSSLDRIDKSLSLLLRSNANG